jgi:hypothetical protein
MSVLKTSICWYKFKYLTYYSIQILINEEIWDFHIELALIPVLLLELL